jgi:hypothetical protein
VPETITTEEFEEPFEATQIHFSPEVWSGIPYMHVTLNYCAHDSALSEDQLEQEGGWIKKKVTYYR